MCLALALVLALWLGPAAAEPLHIAYRPVPFSEKQPVPRGIGAVHFAGALELSSRDPRFGGLSGMAASADGKRLIFITDRGDWITAQPRHDENGALTGLANASIGALAGPDGRVPRGKPNRDAESLARLEGGYAVAFEHRHRIWHYPGLDRPFAARPVEIALPPAALTAPANGGIETLVALDDGALIAIEEALPREGDVLYGWIRRRGAWRRFRWPRTGLFRPAGATRLPGGDVLVLERRFTLLGGFAIRLVRVPADAFRAGALVSGRELARIEPPLLEENFEAVTALADAAVGVRLYVASDDNFHMLQRTLLVQFTLAR